MIRNLLLVGLTLALTISCADDKGLLKRNTPDKQ